MDFNDPGSNYQAFISRLDRGDFLEDCSVVEPLGSGTLGRLYIARQMNLGLSLAIRILPEQFMKRDDAHERFTAAAAMMDVLEHPNIVQTNNFRQTDGVYWYRMELATGDGSGVRSLRDFSDKTGGAIDQVLLAGILEDVLTGLACAHDKGIVHLTLTPSALLLFPLQGGSFQGRVSNFCRMTILREGRAPGAESTNGDASTLKHPSSQCAGFTGILPGIPEFAAPEQINRQICDSRTDVYQVGMIVYRLLTGRKLSPKLPSAINPGLDKCWDRFVLKALESRPENRFRNAGEMLDFVKNRGLQATEPAKTITAERKAVSSGSGVRENGSGAAVKPLQRPVYKTAVRPGLTGKTVEKKHKSKSGFRILAVAGVAFALLILFLSVDSKKESIPENHAMGSGANQQDGSQINYYEQNFIPGIGTIRKIKQTPLNRTPFSTSTIDLGNGELLEVVYLPSGSFEMKEWSDSQDRKTTTAPPRRVNLKGFWMGKNEVTQKVFHRVMKTNPSEHQALDHPVENVSWQESMNFCGVLSQMSGYPVTLPSETQWEYACRAGSQTRFHWGDDADITTASRYAWFYDSNRASTPNTDSPVPDPPTPRPTTEERLQAERDRKYKQKVDEDRRHYQPRSYGPRTRWTPEPWIEKHPTEESLNLIEETKQESCPDVVVVLFQMPSYDTMVRLSAGNPQPVGLKKPNLWRLCDMEGNVKEWCLDSWSPKREKIPVDGSAFVIPNEKNHVIRGGCYVDRVQQMASHVRQSNGRAERDPKVGFRIVIPDTGENGSD